MKALLLILISSSAMASTCPLGAGEDHLTLQRVMRNFGTYTEKADAICRAGTSGGSITDDGINQAVSDLLIVEACSDEVVNGSGNDLLPTSGRKDANVAAEFKKAMADFSKAVDDYASALKAARGTQPLDVTAAVAKKKIVDNLADEAHSHF